MKYIFIIKNEFVELLIQIFSMLKKIMTLILLCKKKSFFFFNEYFFQKQKKERIFFLIFWFNLKSNKIYPLNLSILISGGKETN